MQHLEYDHLGCLYLWFEIELLIKPVRLAAERPHYERADGPQSRTDEIYVMLQRKIEQKLKWSRLSFMELKRRTFPPVGEEASGDTQPEARRFVTLWKLPKVNAGQAFFKGDQMLGTWREYSLIFPYITYQKERLFQAALFNPRRVMAYGEGAADDTEDPSLGYEKTFPFEQDLIIASKREQQGANGEKYQLSYLPQFRYAGTPVTNSAPREVKYLVHQGATMAKVPASALPEGEGPCYVINLASLKRRTRRS